MRRRGAVPARCIRRRCGFRRGLLHVLRGRRSQLPDAPRRLARPLRAGLGRGARRIRSRRARQRLLAVPHTPQHGVDLDQGHAMAAVAALPPRRALVERRHDGHAHRPRARPDRRQGEVGRPARPAARVVQATRDPAAPACSGARRHRRHVVRRRPYVRPEGARSAARRRNSSVGAHGMRAALGRSVLANLVNVAASLAASLVSLPFILHHVGTAGYGVWTIALTFILYFTGAEAGFGPAAQRWAALAHGGGREEGVRRILWSSLVLYLAIGVVLAIGMVVAAPWIVDLFDFPKRLRTEAVTMFRIVGGVLALTLLAAGLANVLQGVNRFAASAFSSAFGSVCYLV